MAAGLPARLYHLFLRNALIAKTKIIRMFPEQIGVLHDHGDVGKQAVRLDLFYIPAIHSDLSGLILPKPRHQAEQGGFSASRWAYQSRKRAGRGGERELPL